MNLKLFSLFIFVILQFNLIYGENVKKNVDDSDDPDDGKDENLEILGEAESNNVTTCTRRKNSQMHEIRKARYNQFPFIVAIMSPRNEYVCAGSVIANGLILTTATCTESISYVLINTTTDRKNDISLHITKTDKFPTYTESNGMKDIAIIYTERFNNSIAAKINLSNFTKAKDLSDVEALGFGLNAETGQTRELQYVGVENRILDENKIDGYLDCLDTKIVTCFKDKGGPVIFNNELVGIVAVGQNECTSEITSTYAINKRLVTAIPAYTFKAWVDEKIAKSAETGEEKLEAYPKKPVLRDSVVHVMTSSGHLNEIIQMYILIPLYCYSFF